jgi:hypothetical protein
LNTDLPSLHFGRQRHGRHGVFIAASLLHLFSLFSLPLSFFAQGYREKEFVLRNPANPLMLVKKVAAEEPPLA